MPTETRRDKMLMDFRSKLVLAAHLSLFITIANCWAQENKVMGELRFEGATKVEKDSGVWIDGNYVGFLKELHGDKKVMLLPGDHEVSVRQAGYDVIHPIAYQINGYSCGK